MTHTTSPDPAAAPESPASESPAPGLSRRAVVAGAGGVAAVGLLTACGGGSVATAPAPTVAPQPAPSAAPAAPSASSGTALTSTSDVPVGGGTVFADKDVVVTQPTAGDFKAFSATCTHQGCLLSTVSSGTINCGCHGSQFSIANGDNVAGPSGEPPGAVAALPKIAVKVKGNDIVKA